MTINNIYTGDNVDVMSSINSDFIDLTITSPPYDGIRDYNGYSFNISSVGQQLFRITKDGGVCCVVINDGTKNFAKTLTTANLIVEWSRLGWKLFECCIYERFGRPGAWWNQRFRVDHEYILIFFKGDRPKFFNKDPLKIEAKHSGKEWHGTQRLTSGEMIKIDKKIQAPTKCRGTIWRYNTSNTEGNKIKMKHPATFPDKLANDLIKCFSQEGDIVLDPFGGSGTVAVQAVKNNRQFIHIDISEEYNNIALERLKNECNVLS